MSNFWGRIRCAFILNKEKRKAFRQRLKQANQIPPDNEVLLSPSFLGGINIVGRSNRVVVKSGNYISTPNIHIFGNNNCVEIGANVMCLETQIFVGTEDSFCDNAKIIIGAETTIDGGCEIRVMEHETEIILGEDVMCSKKVLIWGTDSHAILDTDGRLKNRGRKITIGNHVWIGMDVKIGKNTEIGEGSVIGWGSVIPSGKFSPRSLLAGNPASVKKQDVIWSRERPNHFLSE